MSTRHLRSAALFVVGLSAFVYEVISNQGERPTILILAAAMMGLPAFIGMDERRRNNNNGKTPPKEDRP
jgi:hypothetical protein